MQGPSDGAAAAELEGAAWTKDSINCAFCRLQLALGRRALAERGVAVEKRPRFKRAGLDIERVAAARKSHQGRRWIKKQKARVRLTREHGTKYHLGAFRKGYATEALKAGVDTVTLAHLLGHRDRSMVSRVYGHVAAGPAAHGGGGQPGEAGQGSRKMTEPDATGRGRAGPRPSAALTL